jgi:hypothetical protein
LIDRWDRFWFQVMTALPGVEEILEGVAEQGDAEDYPHD